MGPGNDPNDVSAFCMICCVLPFVLGVVGAAIAYYVFGIIFLVDDRYICSDMSPLWIYSLVALLSPTLYPLTLLVASELRQCVGMSDAMRYLLVSAAVNLFVFVYGAIIIFSDGYVCDNMKNAGLYTWAQVALYLNLIACLVLLCTMHAVSTSKEAESFIDNHLNRNNANNEPTVDDSPQEAVPIPEPAPQPRPAHEKDPLLGSGGGGSSNAGGAPAFVPPAAPPARTIAELD